MEKVDLAGDLEPGMWFKDPLEDELWYVVEVADDGDDIHVTYSNGPEDMEEESEAIYDKSAIIYIEPEVEVY
jgi:hypothetical protein